MENNLIKSTCKKLGFSYKELAIKIGYGEGALKNVGAGANPSVPMKRAIELYMETLELREQNVILNQKLKTISEAFTIIELSKLDAN